MLKRPSITDEAAQCALISIKYEYNAINITPDFLKEIHVVYRFFFINLLKITNVSYTNNLH